jgi:anti-sigma B factor antagonist
MGKTLRLEGEMTIYRAAELKRALVEAVERPGALKLDLSGVTELDTAGLQLLLLAGRTAAASSKRIRLAAHSPAVAEVFGLLRLGLEDLQ